jgi:hypothetical protein
VEGFWLDMAVILGPIDGDRRARRRFACATMQQSARAESWAVDGCDLGLVSRRAGS